MKSNPSGPRRRSTPKDWALPETLEEFIAEHGISPELRTDEEITVSLEPLGEDNLPAPREFSEERIRPERAPRWYAVMLAGGQVHGFLEPEELEWTDLRDRSQWQSFRAAWQEIVARDDGPRPRYLSYLMDLHAVGWEQRNRTTTELMCSCDWGPCWHHFTWPVAVVVEDLCFAESALGRRYLAVCEWFADANDLGARQSELQLDPVKFFSEHPQACVEGIFDAWVARAEALGARLAVVTVIEGCERNDERIGGLPSWSYLIGVQAANDAGEPGDYDRDRGESDGS